MGKIESKLAVAFAVLLLLAGAKMTANSQERPVQIDLNALATKGETIANEDPLSIELRNQQPEGPSRRGFDIGMAAAEGQTLPGPGKQRIYDSLSSAEQRGFTDAVLFSLDRNKNADLAARGAAIAKVDPIMAEARTIYMDVFYLLGLHIGIAAAEGQTLPGPGKQRIHDALISRVVQLGFDAGVSFSLERNKNADFAARGAAIARQDAAVAEARKAEADVLYLLGFDIASGIFGDPAQGAQGNTATGPGSLKIRDSLSAAGQRGFNNSVKLHLSRNYKP